MSNTQAGARVFTRDDPCTKAHLMQCFFRKGQFQRVPVVEARSIIGLNAPKYLLKKGYAKEVHTPDVDYYELTPTGRQWLKAGYEAYMKRRAASSPSSLKKRIPRLVGRSTM